MSHIFTNAKYADMLYVYGFCDGSAAAANVVRFLLLMFHLKEHVNNVWRNRKIFLKWNCVAILLAREDFLHVLVTYEHVYDEHCMKTACTHFTHSMWKIYTVILDDRMAVQNYLDFLQNVLPEQLEDAPLATRIAVYFQHYGAPSRYTGLVLQHLNDTFPNQWIGRGSTIKWPPRSPYLTALDFCLCSWMKSEMYRRKVGTRDELLDLIMNVIARTKGKSRCTKTSNTPCPHTSCKVH